MKMYDIVLDTGEQVTVIAETIRSALDLAEVYGETAVECTFVRNIDNLRIEASLLQ